MYKQSLEGCPGKSELKVGLNSTVYLELFPDTGDLRGSKVWREVCCGSTGRNDHPTAFMVEWK